MAARTAKGRGRHASRMLSDFFLPARPGPVQAQIPLRSWIRQLEKSTREFLPTRVQRVAGASRWIKDRAAEAHSRGKAAFRKAESKVCYWRQPNLPARGMPAQGSQDRRRSDAAIRAR